MVFGRPRAMETYCRDEMDRIALCRVSDFVADYETGEVENGCSGPTNQFALAFQSVTSTLHVSNNSHMCIRDASTRIFIQ
jgi:hypothetical protein